MCIRDRPITAITAINPNLWTSEENFAITKGDYSDGHWGDCTMMQVGVRVTMQGVVRHGRSMILPVLLGDTPLVDG